MQVKKVDSFLQENGSLREGVSASIPEDLLLKGYRTMVETRIVEDRMVTLQRQGMVSIVLTSKGEEAIAVASAAALEDDDIIYPQYREHGTLFWRGFGIPDFVDGMFCNERDINKGRPGPNLLGSRKLNIVTPSAVISSQIPHAAGCGYALKLKKSPQVALCFFGDGGTSEGDFHCGINFAAVRKCPVIFICRNNQYAISTRVSQQCVAEEIASKGEGYGVPSYSIDGNDFFGIYHTLQEARERCLREETPIFIEAISYRLGAHSTSDDPSVYRSEEETQSYEEKCPIKRLRRYLEAQGLWDAGKEEAMVAEITKELDEAVANAKSAPPPRLETMIEDVYSEPTQGLIRQLEKLQSYHPNKD